MKWFLRTVLIATVLAIIAGIGWDRVREYSRHSRAQRVEAALARRISLHDIAGYSRPLWDVLAEVSRESGVPIVYSPRKLAKAGVDLGRHVDVPDAELPLETALRIILQQRNLAAVPIQSRILLTTADDARERRYPQTYPLPVDGPEAPFADNEVAWDRLLSDVTTHDTRSYWRRRGMVIAGGSIPGRVRRVGNRYLRVRDDEGEYLRNDNIGFLPGVVVVNETWENHRRITALLTEFERASASQAEQHAEGEFAGICSAAERRILASLEQPVRVRFENVLLTEALAELSRREQVPIFLHHQWLADNGIEGGWRVTFSADGLTLRSVLGEIAHQHGLSFSVQDELIQITSASESKSGARGAVFNVADLLTAAAAEPHEMQSIVQLAAGRDPENAFDDAKGPIVLPPVWLHTEETQEDHRRIARLLAQLRRGLLPGSSPALVVPAPQRPPGEERMRRAMAQEVALVYRDRSLRDICADLSRRLGIRVVYEEGCWEGRKITRPSLAATCRLCRYGERWPCFVRK